VKNTALVYWTSGHCYKAGGYSIFHKDETGLLNPPSEVLFFQTFGLDLDTLAAYVPPPAASTEETWPSKDYDARWRWTTILMPNCIGHGMSHPLSWETIDELVVQREKADRAIGVGA
jgi:hypothetical protein